MLPPFFLPLPPPPSSTLFPYTTLFRSPRRFRLLSSPLTDAVVEPVERGSMVAEPPYERCQRGVATQELEPVLLRDRKSTRLNSSHRCISYAVFCLKKKKKDIIKGSTYV